MGLIIAGSGGVEANVDATRKSLSVHSLPPGDGYFVAGETGTMAAALGANSIVFAMKYSATATRVCLLERSLIDYLTIVAYGTPLTAGRRLVLIRGVTTGALTFSGGTQITSVGRKDSASPASGFDVAQGGDIRVASTGALTTTGVTWETNYVSIENLADNGNAGSASGQRLTWGDAASPLVIRPGEWLGITNPQAMDATGTWRLISLMEWHEI